MTLTTVPAGNGAAVRIARGQILRVVDPMGGQTGDLTAFRAGDAAEWLSNGRSFDYAGKIYLSTGDVLHSNRSNPMLTIVSDDVGRHDFLYTACSNEMYRIQYGATEYHTNCLDNLAQALADQGVVPHLVPTPFNLFVNATVQPDGRLVIAPPRSRAGDAICLRAEMDLAIGLSACPAALCNGGAARPLAYEVLDAWPAA
jgi:uncharacterized protein YcgI (DUF1989 family)